MYGVIIKQGPQNWQILQQRDGAASVFLAGEIAVEPEIAEREDTRVLVWVNDEQTGARILPPVFIKPVGNAWSVTLRIPAGGPYRIDTCLRFKGIGEKRGDRIFHVGVGDVYVIAGQSNAVGVGKDPVSDPPDPAVHLYRVCGAWDMASHPLHDSTDTAYPLTQEKVQTGHSPWLNFAKILHRHLGYPIGLIPATKGGIPLSCWDREEDGAFFDNMLAMIDASGCGGVRGILWYHGCQDTAEPALYESYYERFARVCRDFRSALFDTLPILTVQLNKTTCTYQKDVRALGLSWAAVREAQRRAMHDIPGVYMAPSIDCPVCDGVHNASSSNLVIGERVANLALRYIYDRPIVCDAPDIDRAVKTADNQIRLVFRHVGGHLFANLNPVEELMFTVEDEAGEAVPTGYACPGDNTLLLSFDRPLGRGIIGCRRLNLSGLMPYDVYSYLPVIPFDGIPIVQGE